MSGWDVGRTRAISVDFGVSGEMLCGTEMGMAIPSPVMTNYEKLLPFFWVFSYSYSEPRGPNMMVRTELLE